MGEGQRMARRERVEASPRASDLPAAARPIAGLDVELSQHRERLGFAARRDDALEPRHRGVDVAARDLELGEVNAGRRELGQVGEREREQRLAARGIAASLGPHGAAREVDPRVRER